MDFDFKNLTPQTRQRMFQEFINDEQNGHLYVSNRIKNTPEIIQKYFKLLTDAFEHGTDATLCTQITRNNILKENEEYRKDGQLKMRKMPSNANEILGQGEFKRYYMRALCRQAIDENKKLLIYRARESKIDSDDAKFFINKIINPKKLSEYLKINPEDIKNELPDDKSPEYRLLRFNTGLCIKFL